jgi:hypothetical protein
LFPALLFKEMELVAAETQAATLPQGVMAAAAAVQSQANPLLVVFLLAVAAERETAVTPHQAAQAGVVQAVVVLPLLVAQLLALAVLAVAGWSWFCSKEFNHDLRNTG